MRKENGMLQRLGALLLTFAMLVSMCPMKVAAEGGTAINPFKYNLVRTKIYNEEAVVEPGQEKPVVDYTYSVELIGSTDPGDGSVEYWWYEEGVTPQNDEDGRVRDSRDGKYYEKGLATHASTALHTVKVNVKAAHLTLVGTLQSSIVWSGARTEAGPFTWGALTEGMPTAVKIGVPFTLNSAKPDGNSGLGENTTITTDDVWGMYVDTVDGKIVPTLSNTPGSTGSLTRKYSVNSTLRATETQNITIALPDYNPTFTVNGTDYSSGATVYLNQPATVKVFVSNACDVYSKDYLPAITGGVGWVDETAGWSNTVTVSATADVTLGSSVLHVTVDSAAPTISNAMAYKDGHGNIVVKYDYTVGTSGIKEVKFNGAVETPTYNGSTATVTLSGDTANEVSIALTNNAGVTATATVPVTPALSASPGELDADAVVRDGYINKESHIRVNVSGVPTDGSASVSVPGVGSYPVISGVATLPFSANGTTVMVTDSLGRTATLTLPSYTLDNVAPTVSVALPENPYYNTEDQKVRVVVSDDGVGVDGADVTLEFTNRNVQYHISSATPYEYTLVNGDHLTGVKVENIKDKVGNTGDNYSQTKSVIVDTVKPEVTLTASDNVTGFYEAVDGKKWATLATPVEDNGSEGTETVTFTATISDPNLPETIDGWTKVDNSKTYKKPFSAVVQKQENGQLTISIPAADLAGNIADAVTVTASDGSAMTFNVTGDVIGGTLYIDRRIPSGSETGAPVVTFDTDARDYDNQLYKDSVTFTATIQDGGSGIHQVTPSVNFGTVVKGTVVGNQYPFTVTADADTETDNAVLNVAVSDNVGNTYTYNHSFAIDAKDPVVAVNTTSTQAGYDDAHGVTYYGDDVTYTVTATDLFPDTRVVKMDGADYALPADGKFTITSKMDSFEVTLTDKVGNTSTASVGKMVVDKIAPEINVVIKDIANQVVAPGKAVVNSNLTYTFYVTDANLKSLSLKYSINGGAEQTKVLTDFHPDNGQYTYAVTLGDGERMTSWSVNAADWASNTADKSKDASEDLLVDTTAPVVTVSRNHERNVTKADVDYFKQDVTYTIEVADENLDADKTNATTVIKNTAGEDVGGEIAFTLSGAKLVGEFTLTDGMMLTGLIIDVQDKGTNRPASINAPAEITFTGNRGVYTSNDQAVVDTTAPTATLRIASATEGVTVKGIYTFDGRNYLKLSGNKNKDVSVKATLTLSDANLDVPTILSGWAIEQGPPVTVNNGGNVVTLTKTLTASRDDTNAITLSLIEKDVLGHLLVVDNVSGGVEQDGGSYLKPKFQTVAEPDAVAFDLTLDNRAPSSSDTDAPVITVTPNAAATTANGLPLYSSAVTFETTVEETHKNSSPENAGLAEVSYKVTGGSVITAVDVTDSIPDTERVLTRSYTIPADLAQDPGETNDAVLEIQAMDKSGNAVNLNKNFAVDNKAPRVKVSFDNNSVTNDKFFRAAREATVTVEDINLTEGVAAVGGSKAVFDGSWDGAGSVKTNTVTFDPGEGSVGEYTMSLSSTDRAGNTTNNDKVVYDGCAAPNEFIIDRKAPTVRVTRTSEATGYTTTAETGKMDFYNKPVTYSFQIQDHYLSNSDNGTQKVNITYTVNGTTSTIDLSTAEGGLTYAKIDGLDTYTYSFTLNNEDVLSDITIEVVDNADNRFRSVSGNVPFVDGGYNGNDVKVDMVAPVVKVVRTGADAAQNDLNGYDFYGAEQTFQVTVTDENLVDTNGSIYKAYYQLNSDNVNQPEQLVDLTGSSTVRTGTFQVTGSVSDLINYIQVVVKDAAGNSAVFDNTSNLTFGKQSPTEGLVYNGDRMIVDALAPTAVFSVEGPVAGYYTNGEDAVFIKLNNPVTGKDTDKTDPVTVTAKLVVSDWNLSTDTAVPFSVKKNTAEDSGAWSGGTLIHQKDGTVVYTKTFTVPYNKTDLIKLDLNITDLAGHPLTQSGLTINPLVDSVPGKNPLKVGEGTEAGTITGYITLDRRQPTSGDDTAAPQITVKPVAPTAFRTADGLELYQSESIVFSVTVNDGAKNESNSGLDSISWWLEDCVGAKKQGTLVQVRGATGRDYDRGEYSSTETITLDVGEDECNTCKLYIVAVDNVGNQITHVKSFAADRLAPRVKVVYDNNDVKNDLYFRADRKATFYVEDINFSAAATKINTQVPVSSWTTADHMLYTAVSSYTVDGDYTLTVESTDLADNHTQDKNVDYVGAAAQKFTLDKTRPVIEVSYSPAAYTGKDDMGTLYYNENTTALVKIKEHNFRANDVTGEFNNGKKLGNFFDGGDDSHNATVLFDQNNRYQFRISYTDLAGNLADPYASPVFSVDTTAPVIDITDGDMTNEHLNIVADDLALQIRVKDQESNLESYAVKITFQNNNFEWITLDSNDFWTATSEDGGNTIYVNFANILKEKSRDGIYTVVVSGRDYAGNVNELTPPLVFSLNRFGSSFMSKDQFTIDFLTPSEEDIAYHNSVDQKLVFQEINPNRVFEDAEHKQEGSALTLMVNGASRRLQRNQDYTVTSEKQNEEDQAWFVYTYTIDPSAFKDGGELRNGRNTILIYGEDEAGNQNTNESNASGAAQMADGGAYTGKIEFVLDTMPPIITTVGIESNEVYEAESQQMKIDVSDSTPVSVKVYLNDQELTLSENPGDNSVVWMTKDDVMGTYTVNVPQNNTLFAKQTLRVVVVDSANNESEAAVQEFYVTTNPFVQLMNNAWLLGGSAVVLAGVVFLTVVTIRKKKTRVAK